MKKNIDEIKIYKSYENSHPSIKKISMFERYWLLTNHQDKPIIVNKYGYLVDGYIRYLVMKNNGAKFVEVENNKPTVYIRGVHVNPDWKTMKEYIWRVPKTKNGDLFARKAKIGDVITCRTKYGKKEVRITGIIHDRKGVYDYEKYKPVVGNTKDGCR